MPEETTVNEGSNSVDLTPIPTPWHLQVRRLRYQVVPVVIFLVAAVMAGVLLKRYAIGPSVPGEVSAVTVRITAPMDGTLVALPREVSEENIKEMDRVRVGDVIAKFDDSHHINAARVHERELEKLRTRLGEKQKQLADMTGAAAKSPATQPSTAPTPGGSRDQLKAEIAALDEQIRHQESLLRDLNQKITACTVRAPVAGTITTVSARPGTTVRQGRDPIVTITEDQGQFIVSYVRQNSPVKPKKDMLVDIRTSDRRLTRSRVQEIGNQVEPVPPQQLHIPNKPEWGIPVRIAMPSDVHLRPGELVSVVFRPELSANSASVTGAAAGSAATD
jgi:multidrug efflux pump subunit AcrA (membrane-fusion protein)